MHAVIAITLLLAAATSGLGAERNLWMYRATGQRGGIAGAVIGYLFAAWFVFAALRQAWKG